MRYLRWVGVVSSLVIVGVLGGFMTPLPADAGTPTLTIDGLTVNLQHNGPGCGADNFFNGTNIRGCYSIVGTNVTTDTTRSATIQIGGWYVGDVSSGNQARVLVNDVSPGTENMKLTGVTFTSATNTYVNSSTINTACNAPTCDIVKAVLTNTFNAQNVSQTVGPFPWQMAVGGYFDPPYDANPNPTGLVDENVVSNKFRLAGQACFNAVPCTPPAISTSNTGNKLGTIDSGVIGSPTTLNAPGQIGRTNASIYVDIDGDGIRYVPVTRVTEDLCNTGSNRCQPTLRYEYEVRIHGKDTLFLTDSVVGCGGSCNPERATTKLLKCEGLPTEDPKPLVLQCAEQIAIGLQKDKDDADLAGAVEAQTCEGTCIIILLEGTPPTRAANAGPFHIVATGPGVCNPDCEFDMTLDPQAEQAKVFSSLTPDPPAGDRTFIITGFPGDFQLDQVQCRTTLGSTCQILFEEGSGNSSTKIGVKVTKLDEGDRLYVEMHVH